MIASVLYQEPPSRFPNLFANRINAQQEAILRNAATEAIAGLTP